MLSISDMLHAATRKQVFEEFDIKVPQELASLYTEDSWGDFYAVMMDDALRCTKIVRFEKGQLEYRNFFYVEPEDGDSEEEIDPMPRTMDFVALAKKHHDWRQPGRFAEVMLEMFQLDRATPLFKYLIKDYEAALKFLHIGWESTLKPSRRTDGYWNYKPELDEKQLILRVFFEGSIAIVYLQLEGLRQYAVTREMLAEWGVTEAQLWDDILDHADAVLRADAELKNLIYEDHDLELYMIHRTLGEVPTLTLSIGTWLHQGVGVLGSLVSLPSEYTSFIFPLQSFQDVASSIGIIAPHLEKEYQSAHLGYVHVFDNSLFWYKNGVFHKLNIKLLDDGEGYEFVLPAALQAALGGEPI